MLTESIRGGMGITRFAGLAVIFVVTALASDAQVAQARGGACQNTFTQCDDDDCDGWRGEHCFAGTPSCPGQFVCGDHENCDEDEENPVAIYCMVEAED